MVRSCANCKSVTEVSQRKGEKIDEILVFHFFFRVTARSDPKFVECCRIVGISREIMLLFFSDELVL